MGQGRQLDPTILREYDIRGVVGETLDGGDAEAIGRAFGTILAEKGLKHVAVGYDGRLSSPDLEEALVAGLTASGRDVSRIGLGPSPMLYYAVHELATDAGVMVTGSHNPPDFNGMKLVVENRSFFGPDIQELGRVAAEGKFSDGRGQARRVAVLERYVDRLAADYRGQGGLKVAWDPGNGATGDAVRLLTDRRLPGEHFLINDEIDGTFPAHHPDPTVERNLAQLRQVVEREGCDVGLAFDGDGDRIGVIDARGRVIWGDQLLVMLAGEVLADHPGAPILCDVKASRAFFEGIRKLGGQPTMWKAGHSHIKTKMAEIGAPLAGEMSAHIFFKHRYFGFDDALYAAVRLLSILATTGARLADMLDALPKMVNTPEIRFDCAEDRKFAVVEEVRARLADAGDREIHDFDGVRVESEKGWWLLRASNTQAVLVARCEAETREDLESLKAELAEQLELSGIALPADI